MTQGVVVFIGETLKNNRSPVKDKIDRIASIVGEYYGVNIYDPSRKRNIVFARQVAMYFLQYIGKVTVTTIGKMFGKDHSTVVCSVKLIRGFCQFDIEIKKQIDDIEKIIQQP